MRFEPQPYNVGNKVTMAASWILLIVVLGGLGLSVRINELMVGTEKTSGTV
jgi:hypothetical protein